jgi:hypothetical protein
VKLYDWFVRTFKPMTDAEQSNQWLFWRVQDIPDLNRTWEIYLRRFILFRTRLGGLFLHHILMSDHDRCPHNHPWHFWSLILWGGYWEETFANGPEDHENRVLKWYGPGSFRRMSCDHTHRVLLPEDVRTEFRDGYTMEFREPRPTWSLVFVSGKKRSWGFWQKGTFVLWRQFLAGDREC